MEITSRLAVIFRGITFYDTMVLNGRKFDLECLSCCNWRGGVCLYGRLLWRNL